MRRIAYACRYGNASAWVLEVDGAFLGDFVEEIDAIVREENRPRS